MCVYNTQYLFPIRRAYYIAKHREEHKTKHDEDGSEIAINRYSIDGDAAGHIIAGCHKSCLW